MANEGERARNERPNAGDSQRIEQSVEVSERLIRGIEVVAAYVLVVRFAIGVLDLGGQIVAAVLDGSITDPLVVVGFIDTALVLFIIVEGYQTVVAYVRSNDTRRIVRLVILTGIIALVRKAIVFRPGEYVDETAALAAAVAYTILILGLVLLLYVSQTQMSIGSYLSKVLFSGVSQYFRPQWQSIAAKAPLWEYKLENGIIREGWENRWR